MNSRDLERALVRSIEGLREIDKVYTDRLGERIVWVRVTGSVAAGTLKAEFNLTRLAEILESELS